MKTLKTDKTFWLLLVICIVTIIPFLGLTSYHTKGEPRESIVSYTMLETDNWILPRNNGGEMAYKPPFFHWSIAAISALNGDKVTEMTSRLPSAIALILMTLGGFLFFAKRKGAEIALLTAFITLTNFELHRAGANCRVDMVLTACTVGALYFFYKWYEKGLKGLPWLAILCMSLGTFTKGPVGSVIPCLVTGVFLLLRGTNFFKAFFLLALTGILSFVLPACWYMAAYRQGGEEFLALMLEENVGRMTNTMSYDSCVNPWPYNFVTLIGGYVPWTLMAVFSLFSLTYRKVKVQPAAWWSRFKTWITEMDTVNLFALTSIVVIFVFYCFPQSKRSVYLMPIYPFIAYFFAQYLFYLVKKQAKSIKVYGGVLAVLSLLLFACFIAVKCGLIPESIFQGKRADENIRFMQAIQNISGFGALLLIAIPTVLGAYWWQYSRKNAISKQMLYFIVALTMGIYLALDGAYQPAVLNAKSDKDVAAEIAELIPENKGHIYEFMSHNLHVAGDFLHYYSINFYLGNRIDDFYDKRPAKGYLLLGKRDAEQYLPEFEKEGYSFKLFYTSPKRVSGDIAEIYEFTKKTPVR